MIANTGKNSKMDFNKAECDGNMIYQLQQIIDQYGGDEEMPEPEEF